jgi:hypothetical protein
MLAYSEWLTKQLFYHRNYSIFRAIKFMKQYFYCLIIMLYDSTW